ncbi:MAG: ammonia-forming cytochrome c nitrite reductase subunit c552, partial [Candidatus Thermoplasmatota archaeon]|nr:ammonia-forming cytochrome c nitrite reductase subunit c552 [Candidatus Thermoplasmatota archaeon]
RSVTNGDNSYMDEALYVGSGTCADCHEDQGDPWYATPHAGAFAEATKNTVKGHWAKDPTIEAYPGVEVTLDLIDNGTGFYMDLDGSGTAVYKVDYVQGAGKWLQVFLTTQGNSQYILPVAWANTVKLWVPFHADMWYNSSGMPKMAPKNHVWDLQCVACHTVGSEIEYNSTSSEWVATWEEDGVACEACHGPGSLHQKPPSGEERTDYIWRTEDSALCGNCHVGLTSVGKVGGKNTGYPLSAAGKPIRPGDPHNDFFTLTPDLHADGETAKGQGMQYNDYLASRHEHSLPTLLGNEGKQDFCLMCHSTDYKLAEEGEEPTLETALHDIECSLCHDMHGTDEENNLRLDKWDTCVQCHRNGDRVPGENPLPPHKEVISGEIPIDGLEGDPWMDGKVQCTDCHMPPMGVREVPYDIPSHTLYFISPYKSIDLGMPNSCTVACHKRGAPGPVQTDEEALAYIEDKSAAIIDLIADAEVAIMNASVAMEQALDLGFTEAQIEAVNATNTNTVFALAFIKRDGSMIHNPFFQMDVLTYSIEKGDEVAMALMPGAVHGTVKYADGKNVSGAEIRRGDKLWATTGPEGSFDFFIAPGDYTFDIYKGDKKQRSFSLSVTADDTTETGFIKFKAEDDEIPDIIILTIGVMVLIIGLTLLLGKRGKKE